VFVKGTEPPEPGFLWIIDYLEDNSQFQLSNQNDNIVSIWKLEKDIYPTYLSNKVKARQNKDMA
jgi:hypothetical protein